MDYTMRPLTSILLVPVLAATGLAGVATAADALEDEAIGDGPDGLEAPEARAGLSASAQLGPSPVDADADLGTGTSSASLDASLPDHAARLDVRATGQHGTSASADASSPAGADAERDAQASDATPVPLPEPETTVRAAGMAAALVTAYAAIRWRALLGLLPLYTRLSKDELLENETRAELVELVEDNPGLSQGELCEAVGAGWGNTTYHLQRLEQAGFLRSEKQGHHRRFYRNGEMEGEEIEALGVLKNDNARKIARYLVEEPGCNQKEVCEALDMSPSLAHKWIARLEENDLVTSEREWRSKHYEPDERLPELVEAA